MIERLHDAVTSDYVFFFAIASMVIAAVVLARSLGRWRSSTVLLRGPLLGAALTALSLFVTSTAPSGDLLRTRAGLPHFAVTSNLDEVTGERLTHVHGGYLLLDFAFWLPFGVLAALALIRDKRAPIVPVVRP